MENEKILYTKYSNDRAADFRIATQIIEQDRKKIVRKSAMEESSRFHVLAMKEHENALNEMFSGTKFKANKIVSFGEDFVDFEYLEGTSYDQILDGHLKNRDMDGFYSAARVFFDELEKLATTEFHVSEKSKDVFGENAFIEGEKAIPVGNIDQIFQNVLVDSNENWNVIDYEWTFDFAIPVRFLKNRTLLLYFFTSSNRLPFYNQEILTNFNLNKPDFEFYKKIDQTRFTKYVQKNHSQISDFTRYMRKNIINPYVLKSHDYIDVFYDTGKGFSEAEKDIFYQFPITVNSHENLKSLRIDPSNHCCIVTDISIKSENTDLSFTTNAYIQKNNAYFFNTTDPQIYVDISGHEKSNFFFNMKVFALDETCSATIAEQNAAIAEQNATIAEQNAAIAEQNATIAEQNSTIAEQSATIAKQSATIAEQKATIANLRANAADLQCQLEEQIRQSDLAIKAKQQEINSIYASHSWRITKPLRFVTRILRKVLRK